MTQGKMANMEFDIDAAIMVAARAHAGQRDKGRPDLPYLTHPMRVMANFDEQDLQIIAVLHDAVEDSVNTANQITTEDLAAAGAGDRILAAMEAITHPDDEPYQDYLARVAANPDALKVKLADIDDNADEGRLRLLPPEKAAELRDKYARARATLGVHDRAEERSAGGTAT